jgi:hypothetical protein
MLYASLYFRGHLQHTHCRQVNILPKKILRKILIVDHLLLKIRSTRGSEVVVDLRHVKQPYEHEKDAL